MNLELKPWIVGSQFQSEFRSHSTFIYFGLKKMTAQWYWTEFKFRITYMYFISLCILNFELGNDDGNFLKRLSLNEQTTNDNPCIDPWQILAY